MLELHVEIFHLNLVLEMITPKESVEMWVEMFFELIKNFLKHCMNLTCDTLPLYVWHWHSTIEVLHPKNVCYIQNQDKQ